MATFDIENLVSGGLLKLKNKISSLVTDTTPTVQLYPVDALKVQNDNTPGNDTLLTELVVAISADKVNETTFLMDSEYFYLTGGTETTASDGTAVVEFTTSVRGLFNAHSNNPPTSADGGTRNFKAHNPNAVCAIPEDYLMRYLSRTFDQASNQATARSHVRSQ